MSQAIDFAHFKRSRRPNNVLMLPPDFEAASAADSTSPVFEASADDLAQAAKAALLDRPRTTLVRDVDANHQFAAVERSKLCRWPDTITVQAVQAADGAASLAIYSAAKYGYRDFGVNRARVDNLLNTLKTKLKTR